MKNLEGKKTVVAFNSMGFPYAMDTTIKEVKEENGKVIVIHKPKRKRKHFKHTYTKDSEMKIYEGWLNLDLFKDTMVSFEEENKMNDIKQDPIFTY